MIHIRCYSCLLFSFYHTNNIYYSLKNRVGSEGLFPSLSSHTTVRAVRHTAVHRIESFVINFGKT